MKPWLASTPSQTSGRASRTAWTRSTSSSISPVSLSLIARACGIAAGAVGHHLGLVGAEREGGDQRLRLVRCPASCQAGRPACAASSSHKAQSSALRAPPGGISALELGAVGAASIAPRMRLDLVEHVGDVVAEIIDARGFAATGLAPLGHGRDDHVTMFENVAGDPERRRQAEPFRGYAQYTPGHQ